MQLVCAVSSFVRMLLLALLIGVVLGFYLGLRATDTSFAPTGGTPSETSVRISPDADR